MSWLEKPWEFCHKGGILLQGWNVIHSRVIFGELREPTVGSWEKYYKKSWCLVLFSEATKGSPFFLLILIFSAPKGVLSENSLSEGLKEMKYSKDHSCLRLFNFLMSFPSLWDNCKKFFLKSASNTSTILLKNCYQVVIITKFSLSPSTLHINVWSD